VKQYNRKGCLKSATEDAKQRLTAISHRLQRCSARTEQSKINRMFNIQPGTVYSNFRNHHNKEEAEITDKQETYRFWNNIWGTPKIHNAAEWTGKEYFDVPTQQAQRITKEDIKNKCKKMANWKSPGPDQVQGYWLKHLTSLHERLAQQLQSILDDPSCMPSWLTTSAHTKGPNSRKQTVKPPDQSHAFQEPGVTVTSRVVAIALGFSPIGVIKRALRLND